MDSGGNCSEAVERCGGRFLVNKLCDGSSSACTRNGAPFTCVPGQACPFPPGAVDVDLSAQGLQFAEVNVDVHLAVEANPFEVDLNGITGVPGPIHYLELGNGTGARFSFAGYPGRPEKLQIRSTASSATPASFVLLDGTCIEWTYVECNRYPE